MPDAGIVAKLSSNRVERYYIFGIIVFYGRKVAKLSPDSLVRGKQICHLYIYASLCLCRHEIYLPGAENTHLDLEPLTPQVVPHHVFHYFFDTPSYVETAKIIADTVV